MVHNAQFWLMLVHKYLDDKEPMMNLCKKYKVDCGNNIELVNEILKYGIKIYS